MLYFAYGSNLNKVQMKRRCPDSVEVTKATVKGYRLIFNRVADIVEDENSEAHGALYEVSDGDIKNLDAYEGYPKLYTKINIEVQDETGKTYKAFVYVMVHKGKGIPNESYYQTIAQGYKDWKIPFDSLVDARQDI